MHIQKNDCSIEYLPFDTEIFGIKCGKLNVKGDCLTAPAMHRILKRAKEDRFKHLVVKIPAENISICNVLEDCKFRLKMCSVELEKTIHLLISKKEVLLFDKKDAARLCEITLTSFSSGTRFHFENTFKPRKIGEFYRRWITNLMNDKEVKIYTHCLAGKISGYVTVKVPAENPTNGHIGLFVVDKKYRKQGIGTKLLRGLESNLYGRVNTLNVMTESINYPALKVYCSNGFMIKKSLYVFHISL